MKTRSGVAHAPQPAPLHVNTENYDLVSSIPPAVITPEPLAATTVGSKSPWSRTTDYHEPQDLPALCARTMISPSNFMEMRLQRTIELESPSQCFDKWLSLANFIKLLESRNGPLTKWDPENGKVVKVSLDSNQLVKNLKKIGLVAELRDCQDDQVAFSDPTVRVYFIQHKMKSGQRFKFFYVTSNRNASHTISTLNHKAAQLLIHQPTIDFRPAAVVASADWWQSTDARKLFKPQDLLAEENDAHKAVLNTIELLSDALRKGADVLSLVEGYEDETKNF